MSAPLYPTAPRHLPLQQAAFKLWTIRQLLTEGGLDPIAAQLSIDRLARHPNPRIVALADATACDLADRACAEQESSAS